AAVALAACLCFCPFVSERQTLALLALALLLRAARRESRLLWLVAGMVSGAALFFSLDFGLIALSAGLCSGLALSVLSKEREQRPNLQPVFRFVSGILLGAVPFLALLAREGALRAFLRISFCEIPALVSETWGLPAGSATRIARETPLWRFPLLLVTGEGMPALFPILILTASAVLLLFRSRPRPLDPIDRAATVALAFPAAALRGMLGRAGDGHYALYGLLFGLPVAWLLYRALRTPVVAAVLLLLLAARLHPGGTLRQEAQAIGSAAAVRAATIEAGSPLPRGGDARVPRPQAE